ncbi:hypothetical protein Rhopal_005303-T1 [Rhodotorula paludigena]|uniref:triacylglycerol lipase n=1 Tax=Rhodotorula paludigena TaxID=86838 RepID=A0AAV5GUK1_9BASI|nr:hypothetical protein Rhopal_005303-T1 [Rhodotorula paludigena]
MRTAAAFVATALAASSVLALPILQLRALGPDGPLVPSNDSFYEPSSEGWQELDNGAIIFDFNARSVYQVLYKTTSATNESDATAATLFSPAEPVSPPKILLFLAPIDSASPDCQVTYALENGGGSNATDFLQTSVSLDITWALSKGYYVAVPDHEGSKAAFISGVTEALAGLDGLRALLNHNETLPSADNYTAVISGYSGGGHASAWASQFLSSYGQDLNVVAAAYGGVPVDLTSTLDLLSNTSGAYLAVGALTGLANAYPELDEFYQQALNPNGTETIELARTTCNSGLEAPLANVSVYSLFKDGEAVLQEPTMRKYIAAGRLGQPINDTSLTPVANDGLVSIPAFQYHSVTDETVAYAPVPAYYQGQCARGAKIHFSASPGLAHAVAFFAYAGDAFTFLDNALNGNITQTNCTDSLGIEKLPGSPEYIEALGQDAWSIVEMILNATGIALPGSS